MIHTAPQISDTAIEYEYDYHQLFKAFIHVWLIPFALGFINPMYSIIYIIIVASMYSTIFRSKSEGFWGVLGFTFLGSLIMMMPG